MCRCVKFHHNRPNSFGDNSILYFEILKLLVDRQIGRPNMHCHTKFHQNQSNG